MKINCYVCRKEIDDTDNYCRYCGIRLEKKPSTGGFAMNLKPPVVDTSKLFVKPAAFVVSANDADPSDDVVADVAETGTVSDCGAHEAIHSPAAVKEETADEQQPELSAEIPAMPDSALLSFDEAVKKADDVSDDGHNGEQAAFEPLGNDEEWFEPLTGAGSAFVKSLWEKIKLESERCMEKLEDGDYDREKYAKENSRITLKEDGTKLLNAVKKLSKHFVDDDEDDDDW